MVLRPFKDPVGLTRFLKMMLILYAVGAGVSMISSWMEYALLEEVSRGVQISVTQVEANDDRQAAVGLLQTISIIVTAVVFLMWIYRANSNARALGAKGMEFTPGWAVGYFFVPIIFLWKPYQAVKEIYRVSAGPIEDNSNSQYALSMIGAGNWKMYPVPAIFKVWWTLWVVTNLLAQVYMRAAMSAEELSELQSLAGMDVFFSFLDILLCIAALVVVNKIFNLQVGKYRVLRSLGQTPI